MQGPSNAPSFVVSVPGRGARARAARASLRQYADYDEATGELTLRRTDDLAAVVEELRCHPVSYRVEIPAVASRVAA